MCLGRGSAIVLVGSVSGASLHDTEAQGREMSYQKVGAASSRDIKKRVQIKLKFPAAEKKALKSVLMVISA